MSIYIAYSQASNKLSENLFVKIKFIYSEN